MLKGGYMTGIYRIKDKRNNKHYYGSSVDIERRFKEHKRHLRNGYHNNIILQRIWDKHGDCFIFEIVEVCRESVLLEREQFYIDINIGGYNIGKKSSGGDNLTNHPDRELIIEKITNSTKERYDKMSDEEKKIKYSKPMEKNPNWRGGISYVYCECGNRITTINKTCIVCVDRNGENNPFYGKEHSDETKRVLREKSKERGYVGSQNIPIIVEGREYPSLGEASKDLGIPLTTIRWRVKSNNQKFDNYKYVTPIAV